MLAAILTVIDLCIIKMLFIKKKIRRAKQLTDTDQILIFEVCHLHTPILSTLYNKIIRFVQLLIYRFDN